MHYNQPGVSCTDAVIDWLVVGTRWNHYMFYFMYIMWGVRVAGSRRPGRSLLLSLPGTVLGALPGELAP